MNRITTRARHCALAVAVAGALAGAVAHADDLDDPAQHVVLISVDGLHQADLHWYVTTKPGSTLARLVHEGVVYTNARTPFPSDSFPGMVGQVGGGNPKTTGISYDDACSRALLPPGTTDCKHAAPGAEVFYAEVVALALNRLDSGAHIPGLHADFSKILTLTGNPITLIDPAQLPVDPKTCKPVYPHQHLQVNTVFEVPKAHGRHTAWSDKHAAYEILSGPSGKGIDDLFAPEINSSVTDPSLPAGPGPDFTKDNLNTQIFDSLQVRAVLNWAHGLDHSGATKQPVPAIFGMNFQTISTAQRLNMSHYYGVYGQAASLASGLGGYTNAGMVPGNVLAAALDYIDAQMAKIVGEEAADFMGAKHGDTRVPDVIGVAQYSTLYAGGKLSKISEHGGDAVEDRHVPIVARGGGLAHRKIDERVATVQIAPTIVTFLGYSPQELQAVRAEDTETLPGLDAGN